MRPLPLPVSIAAVLVCLLLAPCARAQEARDPALAETLFSSAQACLAKGDWTCACEKFGASMAADPSVSTLFNIAKCQEHGGKLALAWASLQQALDLNRTLAYHELRRKKLDEYGHKMVAELEHRVPKIRITVASRPPGLEIRRDGSVVPLAALDEPMRVDPGPHEIVAWAPGFSRDRRTLTIREGEDLVVTLALAAEQSPSGIAPSPLAPVAAPAEPPPAARAPAPGTQRRAGLTIGGVGIVTMVVAGVLGAVTAVDAHDADASASCQNPANAGAIQQCNGARDVARRVQTAAIATGAVGAALFGTGIVLWATSPKAEARSASIAVRPGGASLALSF